ncbi:hypothetical protein ACKLNO_09245 [Neisseriaceae bacterium B1]
MASIFNTELDESCVAMTADLRLTAFCQGFRQPEKSLLAISNNLSIQKHQGFRLPETVYLWHNRAILLFI